MAPGKDDKKTQGTRKSSDKAGDRQQSPPIQSRSKGGVLSEPRLILPNNQQSSQSLQQDAVHLQQHRALQQPSNLQNQNQNLQNLQQYAQNQQSYNVDVNGHCYANYIPPTENYLTMQNQTPSIGGLSAQVDNRMCVNPGGMLQQNNSYNGQRCNGVQSEINGQNELASMIMNMNNDFSKRLTMIENSLSKLGNIENEVSLVRADVSRLKTDNVDINRRILETEISCQTISGCYDDVKKRTDTNNEKISVLEQDNRYLSNQLAEANSNYNNLKEGYLELQSRTMQENLLFFGIPETEKQNMTNQTAPITQNENEVPNDRDEHSFGDREINQPENTEEALRNFIANDLPTQVSIMASGIRFDRVHRLGARKRGMRNPRPIVAKFERYSDRELIRKAGMDLNSNPNSKFKVREQFPREIEDFLIFALFCAHF